MSILTTEQIRTSFIDFFKKNNHTYVASSPLVPQNDPSLMFVNSGMVQFKNLFTGTETRDYTRATTSQKSVRAGGKHNDLDNVGYTARHHTFFEMLGNFSFGDYFKEEAIFYAWNLLTKEFGLNKDKLYITVYHDDDESAKLWKKIASLSDDRIIRIATSDNFWSMGDLGPCGPSSEIFYDHGDKIAGGLPGTPEQDGDRYVEIWNLVFMQFEQIDKDTRILLPKKSVDTGMGLERISAVLQGVHNNYEIDLFKDIIDYTQSALQIKITPENLPSFRVIADHLRSSAFLIADGVTPSNEGRGYVLRRIMRRSMRHAHQLGAKEPLMYKLLPKLVDIFGNTFPEIKRGEDFISNILKQEEDKFKITLGKGLKLLAEETNNMTKNSILPGELAFKLYDTYGFPLDLTEDILRRKEIKVDIAGFEHNMQIQKNRARKAWSGSGESKTDAIWFDLSNKFGATEFLGYAMNDSEGKILALIQNGNHVEQISNDSNKFILIANQTPFYGESGGQMGDVGIISARNCQIKVIDTLKYLGKIIAHICELQEGEIKVGDEIKLSINNDYRQNLKKHHSATHILQAVLRDVVGKHVTQKGSLVAHDRLRFDISHQSPLSKNEILAIEQKVNDIITDNSKVTTSLMSTETAINHGAMALFGEKYDDEVRVVSMGNKLDDDNPYSFELCGGTHVSRTGNIGAFKIISDSAIASGVRRIEAVCGEFAFALIRQNEEILDQITILLKTNKIELLQKVESLINSKKLLEKDLSNLQIEKLNLTKTDIDKAVELKSAKLLYKEFNNIDPKLLRIALENQSKKFNDMILIYISKSNEKISALIACPQNISNNYNANSIAQKIAAIIDGKGGGSANLAQVGGTDINKLQNLQNNILQSFNN